MMGGKGETYSVFDLLADPPHWSSFCSFPLLRGQFWKCLAVPPRPLCPFAFLSLALVVAWTDLSAKPHRQAFKRGVVVVPVLDIQALANEVAGAPTAKVNPAAAAAVEA